ncbi:hypothetical protein [Bifidobacterium moukalabense]|uniref:hypothetical protein n=1 Tax=Bifidobacterium moukalabense TaxID=1333651 RepID=UPI0010F7D9AF|nr:hypothetical protein [Bifidobacterium moukalabense]
MTTSKAQSSSYMLKHVMNSGLVLNIINIIVLFVLLLAADFTSPLHPRFVELGDTDIFRLAGKVWSEGGLPYVDYWDHKGPLIFFTNFLGFFFGDENGVFWVDFVLMAISIMLIRRITAMMPGTGTLFRQELVTWVTIVWIIALLLPSLDMTETVCLPFLLASLYTALREFLTLSQNKDHMPRLSTAFTQGLALAACLMTRVTNGIAVCVTTVFLIVMVCARQQWMCLLRCLGMFLVGFAVLTVPFSVYFAAHGAFSDMIYATITYNLSYASGSSSALSEGPLTAVLILTVPLAMTLMSVLSVFLLKRIRIVDATVFATGLAFIVLFLKAEPYPHYAVIAAVFIPVLASQLYAMSASHASVHTSIASDGRTVTALLCVAMVAFFGFGVNQFRHAISRPVYENLVVEKVVKQANGKVALYDISAMAYLRYDIAPVYRFANLQDWQGEFSEEYRSMLLDDYRTNKAEYIVVGNTGKEPLIQPILEASYVPVEQASSSEGLITVWKLNSQKVK